MLWKQHTVMKISFAQRFPGEGGRGHLPSSPCLHPWGLNAPLCLAAVPPFLAARWERSQAAPSAASGNCCSARQLAANVPTLKLWPAAWEGNWMNLQSFVLFVNILQFLSINLFSPLCCVAWGLPMPHLLFDRSMHASNNGLWSSYTFPNTVRNFVHRVRKSAHK